MADYSEDQKLIAYQFAQLRQEMAEIKQSHLRSAELLTMIHADFVAYKRAWRIIFGVASAVGTVASTIIGWFMHVWTSSR